MSDIHSSSLSADDQPNVHELVSAQRQAAMKEVVVDRRERFDNDDDDDEHKIRTIASRTDSF